MPINIPNSDRAPLFTLTSQGVSEKSRELAEATAKVRELTSWFVGLRVVMGDELWRAAVSPEAQRVIVSAYPNLALPSLNNSASIPQTQEPAGARRPSRIRWVKEQLSTSDGLTILDLAKLAEGSPLESDYKDDPSEFAEWLVSAARGGRLKRRGDRIYKNEPALSGEAAKSIPRANEVIRDAVLSTLRQNGGRAEAGGIVRGIRDNPVMSGVITPQSQYPYTILMRMVADGTLQKDGAFYVLPETSEALSEKRSARDNLFDTSREAR